MPLAVLILAALAALVHVFFFYLESIAFMKPSVFRTFGAGSREEAEILRGIFLNQGFYNLFLAIGVLAGAGVARWSGGGTVSGVQEFGGGTAGLYYGGLSGNGAWGAGAVLLGLSCMLGAALVLLISSKGKMLRGALIQGLLPTAALVVWAAA